MCTQPVDMTQIPPNSGNSEEDVKKKGKTVELPSNHLPWHRKSVLVNSREAQLGVEPLKSAAKSLMIAKVFYSKNFFEL